MPSGPSHILAATPFNCELCSEVLCSFESGDHVVDMLVDFRWFSDMLEKMATMVMMTVTKACCGETL